MEVSQKDIMYVYKLATGNQIPTTASPEKSQKMVPRDTRHLRKSKTFRENAPTFRPLAEGEVQDGNNSKITEGRKSSASYTEARKSSASYNEARKSSASYNEARKSVSHVDASDLSLVMKFMQVKVVASDMPGLMQVHAFRCARRTYDSLEKFSSKEMAHTMKKEFDKIYGPAWHCIVGSSFGSFVTHSTGCFLYFSMEKIYILIFKTKVQRALN